MRNWFAIEVNHKLYSGILTYFSDFYAGHTDVSIIPLGDFPPMKGLTGVRYAIIGVALGGAGWYLTRLARGPTGTWFARLIVVIQVTLATSHVSRLDPHK